MCVAGGLDETLSLDAALLDDQIKYNMRKSEDLDDEGCFLHPGHREALQQCGFNTTARTILIIHGWTVSTRTHTHACICTHTHTHTNNSHIIL